MTATGPIRVALIDDQRLVRAGFRMICEAEPDLLVVGEAADGTGAVDLVVSCAPDVVLMDIRMPVRDGVEACGDVTALERPPKVLMLTTFDLDDYVLAALRNGASGFLLKDTPPEELVSAIRVVAAGEALLAPSVTRTLIEQFTRNTTERTVTATTPPPSSLESLTEREREVLAWMAKGCSNAEIAQKLFLGETTVKTHVGRVLMKLDLRDRVHAVVFAYEHGLVVPGHD
ncbi:MAG: response regulator [Acidimicrobiia bacterium]